MRDVPIEKEVSGKVVAATVAAYLSTLFGGIAAKELGVELDVTALQAFLLPLVTAVVTAGVAYAKKDHRLGALLDYYRAGGQEPAEPIEGEGPA